MTMFPLKMKLVPEGALALGPDIHPVVVAYAVTTAMKLLEGFVGCFNLALQNFPSKDKT